MNHQDHNNLFGQSDLDVLEPDYGTGMRKARGIMDLSQKEAATLLGMTQQQLSQLEKKKQWSEEMLQRVSDKLKIPRSGLDYLAKERDLLQLVIQHNTFSDQSHSCMNNYATYNIGNIDKAEEIISKIENLITKLDKNTEALKKVMPKQKE
ncbi:helix-turn-helix domain-containing protein [Dysgonomonas sp.]